MMDGRQIATLRNGAVTKNYRIVQALIVKDMCLNAYRNVVRPRESKHGYDVSFGNRAISHRDG